MNSKLITCLLLTALAGATGLAHAERADRDKPMNIESDALRHDDLTQTSVFTGNVVMTKGTIVLRGEQLDVRQDAEGYQHGVVTTFAHSIRVACLSVWLADRLHLWNRVDLHSLIRAALLHDYFLYDWHDWDNGTHRLHGFTHGETAMRNAIRDFKLNQIERDSIEHHMFPLTPYPPKYIEGYLVTAADKISATKETLSFDRFDKPASGQPMDRS